MQAANYAYNSALLIPFCFGFQKCFLELHSWLFAEKFQLSVHSNWDKRDENCLTSQFLSDLFRMVFNTGTLRTETTSDFEL